MPVVRSVNSNNNKAVRRFGKNIMLSGKQDLKPPGQYFIGALLFPGAIPLLPSLVEGVD
jgi:hypothetical protein